ncbi:MAG: protein kinase domain-containing protein [Polyangiales bacterium]
MGEEIRWSLQTESRRFDLPLGARMVAGRAEDAPIPLPESDAQASRYHVAFEATLSGVRVVDLDSRNGVRINGKRSKNATVIDGDTVRISQTLFRVACEIEDIGQSLPMATITRTTMPRMTTANVRRIVPPYVCDVCGMDGVVPGPDHEPWWAEVAWICDSCTEAQRTDPKSWDLPAPEKIGELDVLRFLARGGMSAVYEARHRVSGIRAAVKIMLPDRTLERAATKRFTQEQLIAGRLAHPRIVRCFDVGQTSNGDLYVATEFMSRGDVDALASPMSNVKAVVALVAEMFEALAHAHEQGIVHRDVKPANLLLGPPDTGGRAHGKLADFGLARSFREIGGTQHDDNLIGSAGFAAPEQLLGFHDVGPPADVYGGGTSLYWLLTGELPVVLSCPATEASDTQVVLATLSDERVPISKRRPGLRGWLAELTDTMCSRDPEKRAHLTAAEVAAMLRSQPV